MGKKAAIWAEQGSILTTHTETSQLTSLETGKIKRTLVKV